MISATSNDANLSAYAVLETNGHIDLLVINKDPSNNLTGTFSFSGFTPSASTTYWQYGKTEDTAQSQTSDGHSSLTTGTSALTINGTSFSYSFPSYSMTVLDIPSVIMTVQPANLASTGTVNLTLKIGSDGKLHIYQNGTTDVVPPNIFANMTGVSITGRDNYDEVLTIDFSNGNPVPSGGVTFNGGAGGGNTLVLSTTSGADSVTMTATQITDNSYPAITYSNTAYFGFTLGGGSDSLSVNGGTLKINQTNAISSGTNLTVNGGTLDLNGYSDTVGAVTLVSGSILNGTLTGSSYNIQSGTITATLGGSGTINKTTGGSASITAINNTQTAVSGGSLTVGSITTGILTLHTGTSLSIAAINPPLTGGDDLTPLSQSETAAVPAALVTESSSTESVEATPAVQPAETSPALVVDPVEIPLAAADVTPVAVEVVEAVPAPQVASAAAAVPVTASVVTPSAEPVTVSVVTPVAATVPQRVDSSVGRTLSRTPFYAIMDSTASRVGDHFADPLAETRLDIGQEQLLSLTTDAIQAESLPAPVNVVQNRVQNAALQSLAQDIEQQAGDTQAGQADFAFFHGRHAGKPSEQFQKAVDKVLAAEVL